MGLSSGITGLAFNEPDGADAPPPVEVTRRYVGLPRKQLHNMAHNVLLLPKLPRDFSAILAAACFVKSCASTPPVHARGGVGGEGGMGRHGQMDEHGTMCQAHGGAADGLVIRHIGDDQDGAIKPRAGSSSKAWSHHSGQFCGRPRPEALGASEH